jgi:hypothetical protein
MRAGAFAERRVIDLLNRRFVPFYFNTGGPGEGHDADAAAFVKGKVKNKWAHFAVFTPDGEYLGESPIYADKNGIFEWLMGILAKQPKYAGATAAEKKVLEAGGAAAARLREEIGDYAEARKLYTKLGDSVSLARLARYEKRWDDHEKLLPDLKGADAAAEKGYLLLHQKKHKEARELLERAAKDHAASTRAAELRFSAGVACWFLDDKRWAHYHWVWVVENLPEDRLARRCYIAAAAEGMPYENPELDGYAIDSNTGSVNMIKAAYRRARKDYEELKE